MKILTRTLALLAGAVLGSQSAHAQFVANDLYLGFENAAGGGTADYIINLGAASSFTSLIGSGETIDLSSDFSLANFDSTALQGNDSGSTIMAGIVGGTQGNSAHVFATTLWAAYPTGYPSAATLTRSEDNATVAAISQMGSALPTAGNGTLDASKSWENYVEPTFTTASFYGNSGVNPDYQVSTSSVFYEALWETSDNSLTAADSWNYVGYLTLDLTGDSGPDLTFTPAPEPSSYLISGAGGILLLLLRGRLWRRNA